MTGDLDDAIARLLQVRQSPGPVQPQTGSNMLRVGSEQFPGEFMPNVMYRTVYRGYTPAGEMRLRFVEASGFGVCFEGHPYQDLAAVRYRDVCHAYGDPSLGETQFVTAEDFQGWMQKTGASVDLARSAWANVELSEEERAA